MKTILVSGASGILGYGILKTLQRSNNFYKLIGTSIYDDSIAPVFCDIFEKAVRTDSDDYKSWLISIIKKHEVDMIIPGIECDMYKFYEYRDILDKITFPLINSNYLIETCEDKYKFYKKLIEKNKRYSINTNLFNKISPYFDLPFIFKPRHGFGSQGIIKIHSYPEYENNESIINSLSMMEQPIIKGDEYTTGAFFDSDSNLIDYITFKRKLSKQDGQR